MVLGIELFDSKFLFLVLLYVFYCYATSTFNYWRKKGVPFLKPLPLFGNSLSVFYSSKPAHERQQDIYTKYKREKYVGRFQMRRPDLYVLDPDLIHRILVEDFNYFRDRGFRVDEKLEPLSQHLVNTDGPKWKSLRTKLSPAFSSGKLKTTHLHLIECCNQLKRFMAPLVGSKEGFEARDLLAGFATDVIGHSAFGIQMNALNDPKSYFRIIGRRISKPSYKSRIKFLLRTSAPGLLKLLGWKSVPQKMENFFIGVIKEAMKIRETQNIRVPDFLQLLIDVKNEDDRRLREKENINFNEEVIFDELVVTANAFVFFAAGFETTSLTLSFCLFELSLNQSIQTKLRDEIRMILKKYNSIPTFEAVKEMIYMDQVLSETLRKYPPAETTAREVTNEYKIKETGLTIDRNCTVHIPIYSLHHDPEYFPEPEKFVPERFSEENKRKIRKGTYLPFGDGPRMCIGARFAKLEIKVALAVLLNEYKFTPNSKTTYPFKFNPKAVLLSPIDGFWLNVENISNTN